MAGKEDELVVYYRGDRGKQAKIRWNKVARKRKEKTKQARKQVRSD
jgi:hypothetical protein